MATSAEAIRQVVAQRTGHYLSGVVTTISTPKTIFDTTNRYEGSDILAEGWLKMTSGVASGCARKIASTIQGSASMTLYNNLTASPGIGDTYEVYTAPWSISDYDQAIRDAIRASYPYLHRRFVGTISIVANTYTYSFPTGMEDLQQAWYELEQGLATTQYAELDGGWWWRSEQDGTKKVEFDTAISFLTNRKVKLLGTGPLSVPSIDGNTIEINHPQLEIIYKGAAYHLMERELYKLPPGEASRYKDMLSYARQDYEQTLRTNAMRPPRGVIRLSQPYKEWNI